MCEHTAVGKMVAETGGDGRGCGTTARLSDLSMPFQLCVSPLKVEVRCSPEASARPSVAADREKRQICTVCLFADSDGLKKDEGLMLSPIHNHTSLSEGVWGRGKDLTWQPAVKHLSHKQQPVWSRSGASKGARVKERIPKRRTARTEPISQKEIKLTPKTIGNRKGDFAWSRFRWQTQPDKLCKLQSTNQLNGWNEWN